MRIINSGPLHLWCFLLLILNFISIDTKGQESSEELRIKKTDNFKITGNGSAKEWAQTTWTTILPQSGPAKKKAGKNYPTAFKVLYSDLGIYCLFECADSILSATITEDFGLLYTEDVVEVFLWPDTKIPLYLEYEISPLNYELAILVPNINGHIQGWKPWIYQGDNMVQHATSVSGGLKQSKASIKGWKAEFFIPFSLMRPIVQSAPKLGDRWKGNFYRIDYDQAPTYYSWKATSGSFHDIKRFGTLIFD